MKILLTEIEIDQLSEEWLGADEDVDWAEMMCKAQLKKVVEWGEIACGHDIGGYCVKRWACPICRQAILKEVEDATELP